MSYIRTDHGNRFVEGSSKAYVFPASHKKGNEYIEDYGNLSKEGLCEIVCAVIERYYKRPAEKNILCNSLQTTLA